MAGKKGLSSIPAMYISTSKWVPFGVKGMCSNYVIRVRLKVCLIGGTDPRASNRGRGFSLLWHFRTMSSSNNEGGFQKNQVYISST